ncbi:hypothetical protein BU17DRAFT_90661 [Hysterangium stoloniferum]|nr:hypothetical protein BU17DRAFT_90661 [Hysterangium stoloniferum]
MSTLNETTLRNPDMAMAETLQEGIEELPPLVSTGVFKLTSEEAGQILETRMRKRFRLRLRERWSCNEPGHDLCCRTLADDQHIPLSAKVWVDELFKGDTSYNDPPTVVKMAGRPANTTSNHGEGVEEQSPLVSPGELSSEELERMLEVRMREKFQLKLRERWSCTEPGHDLCYRAPDDDQHIRLSANYVEVWVDRLCQGETSYHEPPTVVKMSERPTNTTSNHREGIEGDIPADHQHMPLSANDAEARVDEMYQGEPTYHDSPTAVQMAERCTNTTPNLRKDVEELPPLVPSYWAPVDDQDVLSANHVEVSADEFKLCQGKTNYHDPPTVVTMLGGSIKTPTSGRQRGIEEQPPLVSPDELNSDQQDQIIKTRMREIFRTKLRERWICYEPGHELCYRTPDNDQHLLLSENHVEFWVHELWNGNTSYHDLPAFGKTPWSSTNTTSNLRESDDELPTLRSPDVLSSEQWDQIVTTDMREIFRAKLRERWSCNETGHNLCYRTPDDDQHIPLSPNDVEVWVEELCEGETTYHEPPIVVTMPGRSTTSNLGPYLSHDVDWGIMTRYYITSTSIEKISPSYYVGLALEIGLALERIGTRILYPAKKATLMARLTLYGRMMDFSSRDKVLNKFLRKSASLPRWGIVIQRSIDLSRPIYPLQIREQASRILGDFWLCCDEIQLRNNRDTMTLKLIASLGRAFICCPGAQWWDRNNMPAAITSSLYNTLIELPLHTNLDNVSSIFIVKVAHYLSDPHNQHPLLIGALADVIENVCHVRQLSVEELIAIRAYFETWLNQHGLFGYRLHRLFMHCVSQDTWFLDISGTVLNYVLRNIGMDIQTLAQSTNIAVSLFINLEMLENFLDNKSLFIAHNSQLIIIVSFMVSILRHVPIFFFKYCHNQLRY